MPFFTPETVNDVPVTLPKPHPGNSLMRYYRPLARGRSVIKIAGTWTTVDGPTADQINDATPIVNTLGETVPGAFVGGYRHPITTAVKTELDAAGFTTEA